MDHEKPEAVMPQVFEYGGESRSTDYSEFTFQNVRTLTRTPSVDEPEHVEDQRERHGEGVW
jgi:amino acid transporter